MGKSKKARPEPKPVNDNDGDFFDEEIQQEEALDEIEALKNQIASLQAQLGEEKKEKKPGFIRRGLNALKRHKTEVAAVAGVVIGAGTALICSAMNSTPININMLDGLPDNGDPDEEDENEEDEDIMVVDI